MATLNITNIGGTIKDTDMIGKPDPLCIFKIGNNTQQTAMQKNTTTPRWSEQFSFKAQPQSDVLEITVKDKDIFSSETIGTGRINLRDLSAGQNHKTVQLDKNGGTIDLYLNCEGHGWEQVGQVGAYRGGAPGPFNATPAAIFTDRDALNHHFMTYRQAYEAIVAFFEREDRLLSDEKLQFEEWKLSEQQLINQQSAELMRKQQEMKQYEADLMQFLRSIEASEVEIQEQLVLCEQAQVSFESQRQKDLQQLEMQKKTLDDHQMQLAEQLRQLDEKRAYQREVALRQQKEQVELQREAQQQAQQQLIQQQALQQNQALFIQQQNLSQLVF